MQERFAYFFQSLPQLRSIQSSHNWGSPSFFSLTDNNTLSTISENMCDNFSITNTTIYSPGEDTSDLRLKSSIDQNTMDGSRIVLLNHKTLHFNDGNATRDSFWSEENIKKLLAWAEECNKDWKKVAKRFRTSRITAKFVQNKYHQIVYQQLPRRRPFTEKEDALLARLSMIYGKDWDKIAERIPGRSPQMLKNRYYFYLRKKKSMLEVLSNQTMKIDYSNKLIKESDSKGGAEDFQWLHDLKFNIC